MFTSSVGEAKPKRIEHNNFNLAQLMRALDSESPAATQLARQGGLGSVSVAGARLGRFSWPGLTTGNLPHYLVDNRWDQWEVPFQADSSLSQTPGPPSSRPSRDSAGDTRCNLGEGRLLPAFIR